MSIPKKKSSKKYLNRNKDFLFSAGKTLDKLNVVVSAQSNLPKKID